MTHARFERLAETKSIISPALKHRMIYNSDKLYSIVVIRVLWPYSVITLHSLSQQHISVTQTVETCM